MHMCIVFYTYMVKLCMGHDYIVRRIYEWS